MTESKPWLAYGGAIQVMHGEASNEDEQKDIVSKFGLKTRTRSASCSPAMSPPKASTCTSSATS
ncbi:hypothetical protein SBADM41S_04928 [Streptomyces badius]